MEVSALIPTYNRRSYVFRAIDSVLAQTVPVDEVIVVDDGSTDGTADAIRSRYGSRVAVICQENMGVSVARRRAIEEARGKWVAFLDSDDEWLPDRNAVLLRTASLVPDTVAWIFGDSAFVSDKGDDGTSFEKEGLRIDHGHRVYEKPLSELIFDHADPTGKLERPRPCVLEASLLRRSALIELQCFAEGLRHTEDFLASVQFASRHWFAAIPSIVTKVYRTSDLNKSSLAHNTDSNSDHYLGDVLAYALAARSDGSVPWGKLHARAVRGYCTVRALKGLPIRRLALDQFTFGISARSVVFFCAAMLGPQFFRAAFFVKRVKRKLIAIFGHKWTLPRSVVHGR